MDIRHPTVIHYRDNLRAKLHALKNHDTETRRLLDLGGQPPGTFPGRQEARIALLARVEVAAEALVMVLS